MEYLNQEMAHAYACADIVVSRAGANTICELLTLAKPMLLIPYPKGKTSRGDQVDNAASFEARGLAKVLQQSDMTADTLLAAVEETYNAREALTEALRKEPSADGTNNVLIEIFKYAR